MTKRRTSGVQRRARASEAAMSRRAGAGPGRSGIDMRVVALLGILAVGAVILVVVVLFGGGSTQRVGARQVDDGGGHVADGASGGPYSSVPATSGQHWITPASWGVYTPAAPAFESQIIHNLEHGGIVIWYQPGQLDEAGVRALIDFVDTQVQGSRFKVILSPWTGSDFGHPIAVTSWNWLLYLDSADIGQVRAFIDDHYQDAPEPNGGPGPPA